MVAAIVDDKMRELNAKNPSLDTSRLAVLTAVNVIRLHKIKEEHEKLKESMTKKEWNNMIDIIIILLLVMGFSSAYAEGLFCNL